MRTAKLIEVCDAFGWKFSRLALPAGARYSYIVPADIPRSSLPAVSFWTKGWVSGVNLTTGSQIADRLPGVLTSELTQAVRAGRFVLTAREYSEWWCASTKLNGGRLPSLSSLAMSPGSIVDVEEVMNLLVCSGDVIAGGQSYGPGQSFVAYPGSTILPTANSLALRIQEPRT